MDDIAFRLAAASDIPSLIALRTAFLAEVGEADPANPALPESLTNYFSTSIASGDYIGYVAVAAGQIVGNAGMVFHRHPPSDKDLQGHQAYILNVYTVPNWRGRGIASELLRRLIDIARERNCRTVRLHTYPHAKHVYLKAGFTPVESEMRMRLR